MEIFSEYVYLLNASMLNLYKQVHISGITDCISYSESTFVCIYGVVRLCLHIIDLVEYAFLVTHQVNINTNFNELL